MSDRSRGQPWDPSVTLTYEKLAQDRLPKIKEGTKRSRENDEECEENVATKLPATTAVGLERGRSDSSSSTTSSSSSSMSQEEDQKIDGEGDAVMHMNLPALTDEYQFCFSTKGCEWTELRQTRGQPVHDVAEIFSPPTICRRARARGLRGGWSLDRGALCPLTGKTWDLSRETEQKEAWNLFYKTKPKLLIAFPPRLDQDWSPSKVDLAANMCMSQYNAGRKFVFEHPASSLSWSLSCVKRLGELSGIYSVYFDGMRLFTNSRTIDG